MHDHCHEARFHNFIPAGAILYCLFDVEGDTPLTLGRYSQRDINQFFLAKAERLTGFCLVEKTQKGVGLGRIVLAQ